MVVRYRRPTTTYGGPPATAPGPLPPPRVTWPNPNRHRGYARRSSEQLHINTPRKISSEAGNEWRVTTTQTRLAPTSGVCSHSHFGEASRPFRDGARVSTVCPRPRRCVGKPERSHSATGGSDRCVTWVRWRDHDTGWFGPSIPCGARIKVHCLVHAVGFHVRVQRAPCSDGYEACRARLAHGSSCVPRIHWTGSIIRMLPTKLCIPREMNCVPGYPWCAETHIWGKVGRDKP